MAIVGNPPSLSDQPAVLVTGSSGWVGASIAAALGARFMSRGLDRRAGRHTSVVGDLREASVRREALAGVWAVVHVAALHAPHVGLVPDSAFWDANVEATQALLADAVTVGVKRFVFASSTSVYGHALVPSSGEAVWVDENLLPVARDVYDETKLAAEQLVTRSPIPSIVLRIARCFPEPPEVMAVHRLNRGVDIEDVATAHVLALLRPDVVGTFNVAGPLLFGRGDAARLWLDAASLIAERLPEVTAAFDQRGWELPRQIDRVYDSGAAQLALGYAPAKGVLHVAASATTMPSDARSSSER